jgi:predicted acylesterase/phospholipase RssA
MGVVKALHARKLLPKVISGSAVGSLIAALVCTHEDNELEVGPTLFFFCSPSLTTKLTQR